MGKHSPGFTPIKSGFTLIELVIAMALAGIMVTIGLFSYQNALLRARDTKREEEIAQIQVALQAYYNDHGSYPSIDGTTCHAGFGDYSTDTNWLSALLSGGYLKKLPIDPNSKLPDPCINPYTKDYIFLYFTGDYCGLTAGNYYYLQAHLENANDKKAGNGVYLSAAGGCSNFASTAQSASYATWYTVRSPQ